MVSYQTKRLIVEDRPLGYLTAVEQFLNAAGRQVYRRRVRAL